MSMMYLVMILTFIVSMLTLIFFLISEKMSTSSWEKMNSFECGFNIMNSKKPPFSLNFFLVTIMFLMFDIEISIIIPFMFMINMSMTTKILISAFITILLLFLLLEWIQNMLEWTK